MKTSRLVSAVVAGHCVVVGAILCVQGCGTTRTSTTASTPPPEPPMPGVVAKPEAPAPAPVHKPALPPVAKPPVKTWPAETTAYTVRSGDSISLICARFHVSRAEVLALNHITDANKLAAGRELLLPGKVDLNAPMPARKSKPAPVDKKPSVVKSEPAAASSEGLYVVQAGDVLSRIAVRNGTTVAALKEANALSSDRLKIGQKLKLPGAAPSVPAPSLESGLTPVAPEAPVLAPAAPEFAPAAPGAVEGDADLAPAAGDSPATPAPAPATAFRTHMVEPGEDLFHVSLMWDVRVEELQRINGLGTNTTLTAGQQLQIPIAQ